MEEELRLNREADYASAAMRGQHMKLGFLQPSLISRMDHSQAQLVSWHHGAELRGHKAEVPEISSRKVLGSNEYVWQEPLRGIGVHLPLGILFGFTPE